MESLLLATALIEAGAGLFLLWAPSFFARLLLGVPLASGATLTVARIGGTGVLALGLAARFASADAHSCAARGLVGAMVLYNLGAATLLGAAVCQPAAHPTVLWLGVALHAAMATWCVVCLRTTNPPLTISFKSSTPS